ncbi:MAG: metal-dependent hydrolase [Geitlerinemataceae cyanobacterium]
MPSPIVHAVAGYALSQFLPLEQPQSYRFRQWKLPIFYSVFMAAAADLDFVPQLILGGDFHRGLSHSLFFTVVVSAIAAFFVSSWWKTSYQKLLSCSVILYGSHLLLDYFSEGRGIKLFLPFVDGFYKAPIEIFPGLHYSKGLWDSSYIPTLIFEFVLCSIVLGGIWGWKKLQERQKFDT